MRRSKIRLLYKERLTLAVVVTLVVLMYIFIKKDGLMGVIKESLPAQEAGLLTGMLLGDRSGFEKKFYEQLQNSGLVHLVVVSGSNVMLLVGGLIEILAGYLGRKKTIVMALIMGWGYTAMVGWEIPVVRAMWLVSFSYWAQLWGRRFDLWRGLILAGLMMVVGDITILKSVSFWMSITAFIGVSSFRQLRLVNFQFKNWGQEVYWNLGQTVWVALWITPITALIFGKVSILSPISNILVMGAVEVITAVGAIGAILGLMVAIAGRLTLWLIYPLLKYFGVVVELLGRWGGLEIKMNWWIVVGWYLVLIYVLIKNWENSK